MPSFGIGQSTVGAAGNSNPYGYNAALGPQSTVPSYLQTQPWAASQSYLNQLPGMFNTSGLKNSYQTLENQNFNQGSALAAAAANQYVQRARQSGASTLGAGYAQASAMLPVYQQNAQMNSDLQNKLLQYHSQQAQIGAGLSGDIGRLQSGYQSTLADYLTTQQKLQQSQGQFGATFGQNQQNLNQQGAYQQGQLANQRLNLAMQYQKQNPFVGAYATNPDGSPMSPIDGQIMAAAKQSQNYSNNIRGAFGAPQGGTYGSVGGSFGGGGGGYGGSYGGGDSGYDAGPVTAGFY